jgi:hypothetical protein
MGGCIMKSVVSTKHPASPAPRVTRTGDAHPARRARPARIASQTRRTQRRQDRRLANRAAFVATWWAAQPNPKPDYYSPLTLQLCLGQPLRRMAASLRLLGWRRIVRRHYGRQIWLWIPPQSALKPRPRGRPRIYLP